MWETTGVVAAIVLIEALKPNLDPHGFLVLYALTVYSGVTQPMLAYGNEQASRRLMRVERRMIRMEEAICAHLGIEMPTDEHLDRPVHERVSKSLVAASRAESDYLG